MVHTSQRSEVTEVQEKHEKGGPDPKTAISVAHKWVSDNCPLASLPVSESGSSPGAESPCPAHTPGPALLLVLTSRVSATATGATSDTRPRGALAPGPGLFAKELSASRPRGRRTVAPLVRTAERMKQTGMCPAPIFLKF